MGRALSTANPKLRKGQLPTVADAEKRVALHGVAPNLAFEFPLLLTAKQNDFLVKFTSSRNIPIQDFIMGAIRSRIKEIEQVENYNAQQANRSAEEIDQENDYYAREYLKHIIDSIPCGDPRVQSDIEAIRSDSELREIYSRYRAEEISRLSFSGILSAEAKTELFGADLSQTETAVRTGAPKITAKIPGADAWGDVSLRFLEFDRVVVAIKGKTNGRFAFFEIKGKDGFVDRTTKGPNKLWELLKEVAVADGCFRLKAHENRQAKERLLKRLQTELRAIFGLNDQPFKAFSRNKRYTTTEYTNMDEFSEEQVEKGRLARFHLTPEPFKRD